uniref:Uncharacterized protein n=1 Tax=uncultured marine group II/III euryarchaeote KM3_109_G01 TaxID=1457850 RepID=A0A075G6V3_9EURY|nr:hypothetical protein [uncultured marine group II/III euryarchaeote KM3_109_G01]
MFSLPSGESLDADIDLAVTLTQFPFDFGFVSYFRPRQRTPCAHRLICAGSGVGWLAEGEGKTEYLAGPAAEAKLLALDDEFELRARGGRWTQLEFENVAQRLLVAFNDPEDLGALLPAELVGTPVAPKDLALLTENLVNSEEVRGAFAFQDGLLICAEGDFPGEASDLAASAEEQLQSLRSFSEQYGSKSLRRFTLVLAEGTLLLAETGDAVLGLWTDHSADHTAIISNAATLLQQTDTVAEEGLSAEELPAGFIAKETKGGVDKLIQHLVQAEEDLTTGYVQAIPNEGDPICLLLHEGVPSGIQSGGEDTIATATHGLTSASSRLQLHRLDRFSRLVLSSGTLQKFSLAAFCSEMTTTRTRSEARKKLLRGRLDRLYRFQLGLEAMDAARQRWMIAEDTPAPTSVLPVSTKGRVLQPAQGEIRAKIERLEKSRTRLEGEKTRLETQLENSKASTEAGQGEIEALQVNIEEGRDRREELSHQLDSTQLSLRQADEAREEETIRAAKLARRVSELEHQVHERAEELASALGEMESRKELLDALEGLLQQEVRVKTELDTDEQRLREVRQLIDHDEQVQRILHEQVAAQRDRQRQAKAELSELERRIGEQRDELKATEAEAHANRQLLEQDRLRNKEIERRHTLIQSELRELMEERRQLLRELGDLDARRGQAQTELISLIEQSEELQDVHETALLDIEEAERIRFRLQEEPLAKALLGDDSGLAALEPVLERIDAARSRGYSVVLLDKAIERGLRVIQHTVEEVGRTPRYLLSNEVMDLLERQAPETAGTVRGLTRWSVQNRLEHRLAETVQNVVLDLEALLNDYEQATTMLIQLREVLRTMIELGLPPEEVQPLQAYSHMPEALPTIATAVRRLLDTTLNDIYLEADRRDSGAAATLESTIETLESLVARLDASGLTGDEPEGRLWAFQITGALPFEELGLAESERPAIDDDSLQNSAATVQNGGGSNAGTSTQDSVATAQPQTEKPISEETWEPIEPPLEQSGTDVSSRLSAGLAPATIVESAADVDELSQLDAQLSQLDSDESKRQGTVRGIAPPLDSEEREALDSLEQELADLDI